MEAPWLQKFPYLSFFKQGRYMFGHVLFAISKSADFCHPYWAVDQHLELLIHLVQSPQCLGKAFTF